MSNQLLNFIEDLQAQGRYIFTKPRSSEKFRN